MTETEILSFISGVILPFITDLVAKKVSDTRLRFLIALGLSGVFGLAVCFLTGKIASVKDITANIGVVFATSQTAYKVLFKDKYNL